MKTSNAENEKSKSTSARVVREFEPGGKGGGVHGLTFDGERVWFARDGELLAIDPESGKVEKRFEIPGANAGTAFDGENLYQIAGKEIVVLRPSDGRILRRLPAPHADDANSGMAWADGYLWIGRWRERKINKVDPKSGEVVKTLSSDRWVTGVSYVDGALWHGAQSPDGEPSEIRRVAVDGTVQEAIVLPKGASVSGLEGVGSGRFFCGGGSSGKVRLVEK